MALEVGKYGQVTNDRPAPKARETARKDTSGSAFLASLRSYGTSTAGTMASSALDSYVRDAGKEKDGSADGSAEKGTGGASRAGSLAERADKFAVTKMSAEERAELVSQLKNEQTAVQESFLSKMMQGSMGEQYRQWSNANAALTQDGNGIWKFIASGNYTVDAETKANAEQAVSEDGYYGVKNTSQRLFDFVSAMAGDDPELMQKYQKAVEKGYNDAERAWGSELPEISRKTLDATNDLFDEYYRSKGMTA